MIYGIGMDGVTISRMEKLLTKEHFIQRVFSEEECALFLEKGSKAAQTAAACYASKEAFLKACGKGLWGFPFLEMAALRKESGAPYIALSGAAEAFCQEHGLKPHLTISHENGMAFAFVVLEQVL